MDSCSLVHNTRHQAHRLVSSAVSQLAAVVCPLQDIHNPPYTNGAIEPGVDLLKLYCHLSQSIELWLDQHQGLTFLSDTQIRIGPWPRYQANFLHHEMNFVSSQQGSCYNSRACVKAPVPFFVRPALDRPLLSS